GAHLRRAELQQAPVPRIATGIICAPANVVGALFSLVVLRSAHHAHAHDRAAHLALHLPAAALGRDVLPNLLPRFRIIESLGVVACRVPDYVRALSQCATHGITAHPFRQLAQFGPDGVYAVDLSKVSHAATPAPTTCPMPTGGARRESR